MAGFVWRPIEALKIERIIEYENHDLAIARSCSSRPDPALAAWLEAFKCLNI